MKTMKLFPLAMLTLTMLPLPGRSAEVSEVDIAATERHLKAALKHNREGDLDAALQSIRKASRCDSVDDAVEKEPIGITTPRLIEFTLQMALQQLKAGKWWRAALTSQHMAGCYSVTLFEEIQAAVVKATAQPQSPDDAC